MIIIASRFSYVTAPANIPRVVDIIAFYHSAANTINFASYTLRVVHGLDTTPSENCGRMPDGSVAISPISEEWTNKGISVLAITSTC